MAASDYDFILTRNELIEQSFKKVGALVDGEALSAEQIDTGVKRLNLIVKDVQSDNVFLWQQFVDNTPITVGTDTYDLPTDPPAHAVDKAFYKKNDRDEELEYLAWREYQDVYDKTTTGKPTHYSIDQRNQTIYLWPVPNEIATLSLFCISKLKDFDDSDGSGDFPAKWQRFLMYALAADLGEDFALSATEQRKLESKAQECYMRARSSEMDSGDCNFVSGAYD